MASSRRRIQQPPTTDQTLFTVSATNKPRVRPRIFFWLFVLVALLSSTFVVGFWSNPPSYRAVVALAIGYTHLGSFEVFVGSLRWTGYTGTVILGVSPDLPEKCRDFCERHNVILVYPDLDSSRAEQRRWRWYEDVLKELPADAAVLLTDFRDVLFQRDPFADIGSTSRVQLFGEHPSLNVGLKNHNTWWIEKCWQKVPRFNVTTYCSGTILGPANQLIKLMKQMRDTLNTMDGCVFKGSDQGALNYLVHTDQLVGLVDLVSFNDGIVNTVGAEASIIRDEHTTSSGDRLPFREEGYGWLARRHGITDAEGFFISGDGVSRSPVVHQFDRFGRRFTQTWVLQMRRDHWGALHAPPKPITTNAKLLLRAHSPILPAKTAAPTPV